MLTPGSNKELADCIGLLAQLIKKNAVKTKSTL